MTEPSRILRFCILLATCCFVLSGCSEAPEQQNRQQSARIVKLSPVQSVSAQREFTFPAVVSAVKTIDLSFEVTGRLVHMDIVTAEKVKKGHLLASLDPKPFERQVKEQQTRLQQASRELKRIESMFAKNLVAQSSLDNAKTEYELAEIDLSNAQQDLEYTELHAPFDALVSSRLVENNSFVAAGAPIAKLQDVSRIYFDINVPERLLTANGDRKIAKARAKIIGAPDTWYDISYVEHSTQPDPITQTYEAVFAMDSKNQLQVTPGARAVVNISMENPPQTGDLLVPFRALVGNKDQGFHVWRYIASSAQVEKIAVDVHRIEENMASISAPLTTQDYVVSAGAAQVNADMKVEPYHKEN